MKEGLQLSDELRSAVKAIKKAILQSQYRAAKDVNREQLSLYFGIGRYISEHSGKSYWGKGAIKKISEQLHKELPGMKGFSETSIKKMRQFYEEWAPSIRPPMAVELPQLPYENPSIGIILCKQANKSFVEFLIQGYDNPMGVATYKTMEDVRKVLPTKEELRRVMDEEI